MPPTPAPKQVLPPSDDSFWELGMYHSTVKRVDDGNRLCNDLMNCLQERGRVEKAYAEHLTEWAKRWRLVIDKGPQDCSLERAWLGLCTEAEKVSDLHMEIKASLTGELYEKVKKFQKDTYHWQAGTFKETQDAGEGFHRAQATWAKNYRSVEVAKKAYQTAVKDENEVLNRESGSSPDSKKKLQDKIEKSQQEVQKTKERYIRALDELDRSTPEYKEDMEAVFEQWQQFEEKRILFFKELLMDIKSHLDIAAIRNFQEIYKTLENTISAADAKQDLQWFRSNHGPGMSMNWPRFEDMSSRPKTPVLKGKERK